MNRRERDPKLQPDQTFDDFLRCATAGHKTLEEAAVLFGRGEGVREDHRWREDALEE